MTQLPSPAIGQHPTAPPSARSRADLRRRRAELLRTAGVPRRLAGPFTAPRAGWPLAIGAPDADVAAWDGTEPWCVLFCGRARAGKTAFAAELLWRVDQRRRARGRGHAGAAEATFDPLEPATSPARVVLVSRWTSAARLAALALGLSVEDRRRLELLQWCALLAIDNMGDHLAAPAWRAVADLIDHRYRQHLATILTARLEFAELRRLDDATADQLAAGLVVPVGGRRATP